MSQSPELTLTDCHIIADLLLKFAPWHRMLEGSGFWYSVYRRFDVEDGINEEELEKIISEYQKEFAEKPPCRMSEPTETLEKEKLINEYITCFSRLRAEYGENLVIQKLLERMKHRLVIEYDTRRFANISGSCRSN